MFNLGMGEITVIVLLALIILGPKKLPELASGLGKLIREVRKTTSDVKNEIQLDETIRKPLEELREAVTLHPDELKRRDRLRRELRETAAKMEAMAAAAEPAAAEDGAAPASPDATIADGQPPLPPGVTPPPFVVPPPIPPAGTVSRTSPGLPASLQRPLGSAVPGAPGSTAPGAKAGELSRAQLGLKDAKFTPRAPGSPLPVGDSGSGPSGSISGPMGSGGSGRVSGPMTAASSGPAAGSSLFGPPPSGPIAAPPVSAADRANATQILSEADLSAIAEAGQAAPPPPPPAARTTGRAFQSVTPRLPGATPPKPPLADGPASSETKHDDKHDEKHDDNKSEPTA